jgi:SHS2 domain-containing protein
VVKQTEASGGMAEATTGGGWEHFAHGADVGVRGYGATREEAFEQAALALVAVAADVEGIEPRERVEIACTAPDDEILLVDWLNTLVFEMAARGRLFSRFEVHIDGSELRGVAWGEPVDLARHAAGVEVKGATYTLLRVAHEADGRWVAECVVDV